MRSKVMTVIDRRYIEVLKARISWLEVRLSKAKIKDPIFELRGLLASYRLELDKVSKL